MQTRIFLDYNSTTPLDPRVKAAMDQAFSNYGNPSSIHEEGRHARALIDEARVNLARLLNCDHRRLVFTSGGTEANNMAILGYARANHQRGNHIITSAIEHSSVVASCRQLEREGFEVTYLNPTHQGIISADAVRDAMRKDTILVSIMMANNEVGTLQPVAEITEVAHRGGVIVHTDAVQALGKVPVDLNALGVDLLSVSSHKIYGPKGTGALYRNPDVNVLPLVFGGSHESGLRPGTENSISIYGFGVAADLFVRDGLPDFLPLREKLQAGLEQQSMRILCNEAPRLPNTLNFYSESWLGESMVMGLDLEGFAVSNGSACAAGIIEPSHVILALGYNEEIARSVIRISFGKFTKTGEIDHFLKVVGQLHT
jgi:cysteine sulfinate desulfinase/cysteine desulfurase-like protein